MHQLAIISDTHVPTRADGIPDDFRNRIAAADHTIHAGDFTAPETLEDIRDLTDGQLTAVYGNMDPHGLDLPGVATLSIEDVTFVVTHGTGDPAGYEDRVVRTVRQEASKTAIGVAGHTHTLLDTVVDGIRILNPGSVTGAPPATETTMMTATVSGETVDVTVHKQ
ncbi:MAG: metallophosphoesterase family protein [Halobacteriales archaeon]|nr:metallophosphoesterase family protein [Halobacteriales archaeon]